jgi:hypothetical protein
MARVFAHKSFNWAFVVILMFAVAGWGTTGFGQAADVSGDSLRGAFNVTVNFDDPGIPDCISPTMNTADGGVMAAGCSLAESAGYGQWVKISKGNFAVTFVGQGFDLATGAINTTYKVRATLAWTADHSQWAGPFVTDIYLPDGTLIFTATGVVTGDRIVAGQ